MKVLFTLAVLAGCVMLVDGQHLVMALALAEPRYLLATFVITVIGTIILPALLTWNALHVERIDLSFARLVMINFSMRFYMLVLPRPVSVGMRWLRYKQGGTGYDALALMVFERIVQMLVYSFSTTLLLGMSVASLPAYGAYVWVASACVFLAMVLIIAPFFSKYVNRALCWLVDVGQPFMPRFLHRGLTRLIDAVAAFHKLSPMRIGYVIACSLVGYVLLITGSYVLMQTMDFSISLLELAWIRSAVFLLTQIPVTVGGIGIREVGFIGLLGMYGVAEHDALAFSLLFLFIHVLIGLIGISYDIIRSVSGIPQESISK